MHNKDGSFSCSGVRWIRLLMGLLDRSVSVYISDTRSAIPSQNLSVASSHIFHTSHERAGISRRCIVTCRCILTAKLGEGECRTGLARTARLAAAARCRGGPGGRLHDVPARPCVNCLYEMLHTCPRRRPTQPGWRPQPGVEQRQLLNLILEDSSWKRG